MKLLNILFIASTLTFSSCAMFKKSCDGTKQCKMKKCDSKKSDMKKKKCGKQCKKPCCSKNKKS